MVKQLLRELIEDHDQALCEGFDTGVGDPRGQGLGVFISWILTASREFGATWPLRSVDAVRWTVTDFS